MHFVQAFISSQIETRKYSGVDWVKYPLAFVQNSSTSNTFMSI